MPVRFVLFDAVGTLVTPQPSVTQAYVEVGARHGANIPATEMARRFRSAYARVFSRQRHAELLTSEAMERERWQTVIAEVFHETPHVIDAIFAELWDHFAQASHWRIYDDVAPLWSHLIECGYTLGIASNFDQRLRGIVRASPVLSRATHVFVSSDLGFAKPSPQFYREVERRLTAQSDEILLVGDDFENDVAAPLRVGWRTAGIDRAAGQSLSMSLLEREL